MEGSSIKERGTATRGMEFKVDDECRAVKELNGRRRGICPDWNRRVYGLKALQIAKGE